MEKQPLTLEVSFDIDEKPLDRAIEKTGRLLETLRKADRLIREINGIEPDKFLNVPAGKDNR